MKRKKTKIGIAGHALSGKDTVAEYLAKNHGFVHVSAGEIIRKYIAENNLGEPTRELMIDVGNDLRKRFGGDYLVACALEEDAERILVNGIRTQAEVDRLRNEGAILIGCSTTLETRYERAKKRGRLSDKITFEEFKNQVAKEARNEDPLLISIDTILEQVDYMIENEGDLIELTGKIDQIMQKNSLI